MNEAQAQVKNRRRRKPRPKASHYETGGLVLRNVFAQSRGLEGVFDGGDGEGVAVCKLPGSGGEGEGGDKPGRTGPSTEKE